LPGGTRRLTFSKRKSAGFKATIDLKKKKEVHQGDVSFHIKNGDLISLRPKCNYEEHEGKSIEKEGRKLLLDTLKLVCTGRRDRNPNYTGPSQLGPD
jgi:hypothetical protein